MIHLSGFSKICVMDSQGLGDGGAMQQFVGSTGDVCSRGAFERGASRACWKNQSYV